jgi:hypothetical protein
MTGDFADANPRRHRDRADIHPTRSSAACSRRGREKGTAMLNLIDMWSRRARRLMAVTGLTAVVGLGMTGGALAAAGSHTQTFTDNYHGTQNVALVNPCNGDALLGSGQTNSVLHVTYFVQSDESWATFTESDSFTAVDQTSGATYSGHATFWGNANVNRQNSNSTFTSSFHAAGTDGSTISYNELGHITMLPDGNVAVSFDKPSLSCA